MEAHWVAGELNLRVGSARNGYVLHGLHVGRSLWANLVWTQMVPVCFIPTCMVIRKYGTLIGYIIHIWSHMSRYTSITDGVFSFCLYIFSFYRISSSQRIYIVSPNPRFVSRSCRPISLRDIIGDRRSAKGKFGALKWL